MITGDLDAELAKSLRTMAAAGDLPTAAIRSASGTWRPDPAGDPATYATSLPLEIAGQAAPGLAAMLAARLTQTPWLESAAATGTGYLTVTVTPPALAEVARRIVAAGEGCARGTALAGTSATVSPWPDPAAARTWLQAWAEQATAMRGRLAAAAGACVSSAAGTEQAGVPLMPGRPARSPVAGAVHYLGADLVRYRLARTLPGQSGKLAASTEPHGDPYLTVQRAHAEAASTLRWAADLGIERGEPGSDLAAALGTVPERGLLGLLSWLPERVASAARRSRPDEIPRYLEEVAAAWTECRLYSPALPFGGTAASRDPKTRSARLLLADAVRTTLASGLRLTGLTARERI